jgi:hypothetical protein
MGDKIILPFKPTAKITIELNEKTGETSTQCSKPMSAGIMFDVLSGALTQTFIQATSEARRLGVAQGISKLKGGA